MEIFVYGTLKRGCRNHRVLQGKFLGEVKTLPLYKMMDFGAFPGIVDAPQESGKIIVGELWEVTESSLNTLDIFEGADGGMFERKRILLENGRFVKTAQAYFATPKFVECSNPQEYPGDCWADRNVSDLPNKTSDLHN